MAQKKKSENEEQEKNPKPPIEHGEVSHKNPSGIISVTDEHAMHLGSLQGHGGPGAAGCVVAGPVVHVATEGGTKPLPVKNLPEGVETSGGVEPDTDDQPTSQAGALISGKHDDVEETAEEHNTQLAEA